MKTVFLVLLLSIGVTSFSQTLVNSEPIAYATLQKDTLYVVANMFTTMDDLWNQPNNVAEKPIIIPVKSIAILKTNLGIKED